jgi:hypothetical protein
MKCLRSAKKCSEKKVYIGAQNIEVGCGVVAPSAFFQNLPIASHR